MRPLSTWTIKCYSRHQVKTEIEELQVRVDLYEQRDEPSDFDKHILLQHKKKIQAYKKWLEFDRSILYVVKNGIREYILDANELKCIDVETDRISYIQY